MSSLRWKAIYQPRCTDCLTSSLYLIDPKDGRRLYVKGYGGRWFSLGSVASSHINDPLALTSAPSKDIYISCRTSLSIVVNWIKFRVLLQVSDCLAKWFWRKILWSNESPLLKKDLTLNLTNVKLLNPEIPWTLVNIVTMCLDKSTMYRVYRWTDRRTPDKIWLEKLTFSFSSDELKCEL